MTYPETFYVLPVDAVGRCYLLNGSPWAVSWEELVETNDEDTLAEIGDLEVEEETYVGLDHVRRVA